MEDLYYTNSLHAEIRKKERLITDFDIDYIIKHGEFDRSFKDRNIYTLPFTPFAIEKDRKRLSGYSVIIANDGTIITTY